MSFTLHPGPRWRHFLSDAALQQHVYDLETARQVQQSLFPRELPLVPPWEFAAGCRPARVVAGDYYDLFAARPDQVAVALGDVSGK
ncbi:MAG: hypothetical protein L0Z62_03115, partial [Gemmataceae bacterium]|nr:hypothetical protein [Gemmataceae bacterium]